MGGGGGEGGERDTEGNPVSYQNVPYLSLHHNHNLLLVTANFIDPSAL